MIELLDTHQHLIHRDKFSYGWTKEIPALAKGSYTLADYAGLTKGLGICGTIFMETSTDDGEYQQEARFAHGLAQDQASGIKGIIASIRPESDECFDEWLEECGSLGVVGFRRILHVVDDGVSQSDTFRRNVRKIGDAGKVFDMCFLARQLPIALKLAQSCDNTTLVLDHCGVPDIAGGALDPWRDDIAALARLPHVHCKVSGIQAYCKPGEATASTLKPYVDHVVDCFGTDRVVWGGDWPVVDLANGLQDWIGVTRELLQGLSEDEGKKICHANAERIYKIQH